MSVAVFCTTPDGLETLVKEDVRAAAGDALVGFKDDEMPGIVRFALKESEDISAVVKRIYALRSVEQVCGDVLLTEPTYPMFDPAEVQSLKSEASADTLHTAWAKAVVLYCRSQNITVPDELVENPTPASIGEFLKARTLFRCTGLRKGKGFRQEKPKYKSPDIERAIGEVFGKLFKWRAAMVLYTCQVLVVMSKDRMALGVCLQGNRIRTGQNFHTLSRSDRDKQSAKELKEAGWVRVKRQLELEAHAEAIRERLLKDEKVDVSKEVTSAIRQASTKNEIRIALSENSMIVPIAHALVKLSDVKPGDVICDPMAGSGTTLLEACLAYPDCGIVVGGDLTPSECSVAALNSESYPFLASSYGLCPDPTSGSRKRKSTTSDLPHSPVFSTPSPGICRWNASKLPLRSNSVDVVISDFPFGNRCHQMGKLYPLVLDELWRILRPGGRCTFLSVKIRAVGALLDSDAYKAKFKYRRQPFRVNMGEMFPSVYCLERI